MYIAGAGILYPRPQSTSMKLNNLNSFRRNAWAVSPPFFFVKWRKLAQNQRQKMTLITLMKPVAGHKINR